MPSKPEKQFKIAVCDSGRDFRGGQRQSFNLATGLRNNSMDVQAFCPTDSPLMTKFREADINASAIAYNAIKLPIDARILARKLQNDSVDIFQASDSHSHNIGAFVKRFYSGIKLVVTIRTCFGKPNPFKKLLKYSDRSVDKFVAISSAVKNNLIEMGISEDSIEFIYSCYDSTYFNKTGRTESKALRIGSAGSLESGKGVGTVIDALSRLKEKIGSFKFMVAGEGPERNRFEQQARDCGLDDNVEFCGFVQDMAGFYRNLDLYILASQSEGLGSSLLEAGACGAVPISSKAGGTVDIIEDGINGRLISVVDADELADIIYELSKNPEMRSKFQKEFDKKLLQFDKKYMVEKYIKLYRKLLES